MKIISGIYKGKNVRACGSIRPTQDNVRKALFDILADIEGLSFLELFAGSGAVGLEALSAGAQEVVFVEKDRQAVMAIRDNIEGLGAKRLLREPIVLQKDAFKAIPDFFREKRVFDIIFLDPPYYQELAKKTLQMVGGYDILSGCGYCIVQHFKKDLLPEEAGHLALVRKAVYGDSALSFYAKKSNLSGQL